MDDESKELHEVLKGAMSDKNWALALSLATEANEANPDDNYAQAVACRALYERGDYHKAVPRAAALCIGLHEEIKRAKGDQLSLLALLFVEMRSLTILCQMRSIGDNTDLATVQTYEVQHRLGEWQKAGVIAREADKPLFRALEARLGLA